MHPLLKLALDLGPLLIFFAANALFGIFTATAVFMAAMLIVIPMLLINIVFRDPSSGAAVALSMVPFFAPTLMMLRIALLTPPLWQILASMLLMVLTIIAVVWFAGKIYRVGILMYGKRPNLAELGRWLRYS